MTADDDFLKQFEDRSLPHSQWRHRAHIKVAYLILGKYSFEEAVQRIRSGIQAYNAAHGIQDTPTGGYHETITQAWIRIVDTNIREYGRAESADAFIDQQTQLTEKKVLRLFYSRELIMSAAAKAQFVAPDLAPLPVKR